MKKLNIEDIEDFSPSFINTSLAETKGLAEKGVLNEKYLLIQAKYYYFLEMILEKKLSLSNIEQSFVNAKLKPVFEEEKDLYQYLASHKFFYIRNTLYIENLMKEELDKILLSQSLDSSLEELILSSLKRVIVSSLINSENTEINYGFISTSFSAPLGSLVLGLRFFEEDESDFLSEDAWFEDYCKKRSQIEEFKKRVISIFSEQLGFDVRIIEYFSSDVKKKEPKSMIL